MNNFEKYIIQFATIIKQNLKVSDLPDYIYNYIKNMNVDELSTFLMEKYKDIAPKKLTDFQKEELNYFYNRRNCTTLSYDSSDDSWYADEFQLGEKYPQLDVEQEYLIGYILENEDSIIYADKLTFNKMSRDLQILPSQALCYEFKIGGIKDLKQISNRTLMGIRTTDYKNRYSFIISKENDIFIDIGTKRTTIQYNIANFIDKDVTFKLENNVFSIKLNNGDFEEISTVESTSFKSEMTLILGALKTGGVITSHSQFDFKYLKLWNNTDINRLYRPAYNEDGLITIYDEINKQFLIDENTITTIME